MPTTSPPITPEALSGLQSGQESMLERLFRDRYAGLVEEAKKIVDDDTLSSRVVERAFARVWKERQALASAEAVEGFLHESVHDGAKTALHRRVMLHRIEEHEGSKSHAASAGTGPTPVDEAWVHVKDAIHAATLDRSALARATADHSRHDAALHVASVGKRRSVKGPIIGAVVGLAFLGALFWWFDRRGAESAITRSVNSPEVHVLKSATAQIGNVILDDSTRVRLGADSRLFVPPRFASAASVRSVKLEGAATFAVNPIVDKPFHVVVPGDAVITTTGTEFEVDAYPADSIVVVRVKQGGVSVKSGEVVRELAAGKQLSIAPGGAISEPSADLTREAFSWIDGRFVVNGRSLSQALKQVTRWYGLEIKVPNATFLPKPVTINAPLDSSRVAIAQLEKGTGLEFAYEGKVMMLREPEPGAKKKKKGK